MLASNKMFSRYGFTLCNEKYCFRFVSLDSSKRYTKYVYTMLMRLSLTLKVSTDSNALALAMLSLPTFFINAGRISRYESRVEIYCKLYYRKMFRMMSFFFFSFLYKQIRNNSFFFWPSVPSSATNRSIGLSYSSTSIYGSEYFSNYFFGVVDADAKYGVNLSFVLYHKYDDAILCRIISSIFCMPYIYKLASEYE